VDLYPYDGEKADVFALGMSILALRTGTSPKDLKLLLFSNENELLWEELANFNISASMKDLLNYMLRENP
jgi:hypothetical protein